MILGEKHQRGPFCEQETGGESRGEKIARTRPSMSKMMGEIASGGAPSPAIRGLLPSSHIACGRHRPLAPGFELCRPQSLPTRPASQAEQHLER
jgi:hypothetical protein